MYYNNITAAIGNTPLVKLYKAGSQLDCNLYAKCEFLNPGGSTKDRVAFEMIKQAQDAELIKPGDTLIEASSGNTGIGLAMAGAAMGYKVIITMPEKMSYEKQRIIEALGADVIRTPTNVSYDHPDSHINKAIDLKNKLENAHILDQYTNKNNPNSHYHNTAQEINHDLDGMVDMIVAGVGTGGTISGISKYFKDLGTKVTVVAVDPYGSILAPNSQTDPKNCIDRYHVEGIGYDFVPEVLDRDLVDVWIKTEDIHSFEHAKLLIQKEGLLCGGSSGAVYYAALQAAKHLKSDQNCVMILADGVTNYLNKFIDPDWYKNTFNIK